MYIWFYTSHSIIRSVKWIVNSRATSAANVEQHFQEGMNWKVIRTENMQTGWDISVEDVEKNSEKEVIWNITNPQDIKFDRFFLEINKTARKCIS